MPYTSINPSFICINTLANKVFKQAFWLPLCFLGVLTSCSDKDPDFYRPSASVATSNLSMFVQADVHTHLGQGNAADETHTTLLVEFYGYDKKGYFYNVELSDEDKLEMQLNGESAAIISDYLPNQNSPYAVQYYQDFDTTAGATEFVVNLDRARDSALISASVILPEESEFSVTPVEETITLSDALTVEWTESDAYQYALWFDLVCKNDAKTVRQARVRFPNWSVQTISSPFTFNPANFFSINDASDYSQCELHTSLKTYSDQTPSVETSLNSLEVRAIRQQRNVKILGSVGG